jgi:surface polysaccharide O-acyltransferase-like enzyme
MLKQQEQDTNWIDNLRAIACIFVILLHVSAPWLTLTNHKDWTLLSIVHSLTRSSVPIFIMISGALLLPKKITLADFYSHRFSKIWKPFLVWTSLYTMIFLCYSIYQQKSVGIYTQFIFVFNSFVFGAAYHLWYMYLIMLFYISLLILGNIDAKLNKVQQRGFLLLWVLILSAYQFNTKHFTLNYLHLLFGYFGYFLLGHYLLKYTESVSAWFAMVLILAGMFFTFYPIQYQIAIGGVYPLEWFSYRSVNVMVLSVGLFLFFRALPFKSTILSAISKRSFGIYLIHLLIIMFLNKVWTQPSSMPISLFVILFSGLTLLLSYYSILLMERIPILNKYIY